MLLCFKKVYRSCLHKSSEPHDIPLCFSAGFIVYVSVILNEVFLLLDQNLTSALCKHLCVGGSLQQPTDFDLNMNIKPTVTICKFISVWKSALRDPCDFQRIGSQRERLQSCVRPLQVTLWGNFRLRKYQIQATVTRLKYWSTKILVTITTLWREWNQICSGGWESGRASMCESREREINRDR